MASSHRSVPGRSRAAAAPSPSSSGKQADEPTFLDPTDDATFQSLKKLLSAPASSTQHLSLLSESTLFGSITFYLSKLELDHVAEFAGVISSSGCLWTPPPPAAKPPTATPRSASNQVTWTTEPGSSSSDSEKADIAKTTTTASSNSARSSASSSLSGFLISRSTSVSQAVAAALTKRADLIVRSKKNSTGWASRSALSQYLGAVIQGIDDTERDATPESYRAARGLPIPRLAIIGGLLNALSILKDQRARTRNMSIFDEMAALRANPVLGLSVRQQLSTIQDEWIVTLAEILDHLHGQPGSSASATAFQAGSGSSASREREDDVDEWEAEFRKRTASVSGPASITLLASKQTLRAALSDVRDVPLYMAAQLAPLVPDRKIHALDPVQLTSVTSDAILSLFEGPQGSCFLATLAQDVHTQKSCGEDGIKILVDANGATANALQGILDSTLFPLLGPLSKLMSRALAKAVTSLTPEELSALLLGTADAALEPRFGETEFFPFLVRMSRLSSRLEASWLASALAGANEDDIVESSRQLTKQLWTTFKTLLFSYTMLFDSMMDALVDMCPSPTLTIPAAAAVAETDALVDSSLTSRRWPYASTSNLPPPYLIIVQHVLAIYSHLYWITSTFGSDGFDIYRKVFYSALDVIGRDGEACIQLLELIAPDQVDVVGELDGLETNSAKRSATTYFLNVAEQLVGVLPDEVVEELILPICRPYLENTRFTDTFESAHSVVLALYSNHKRCILNLAPFYVELLIASYPKRLTSMQFEYAMSTVVAAISDRSDSVAWWVITKLADEIDRERLAGSAAERTAEDTIRAGGYIESSQATRQDVEEATANSASEHPTVPTVATENVAAPTQQTNADTYDRLTHLQMCLIGCVPSVNLVLLRSALAKVEAYIMQCKQQERSLSQANATLDQNESTSSRLALCQKTFDAIQALNAATREEGLRWWLDHRTKFGV